MVVGAVTVDDRVHVELGRDLLVDDPQEAQKLLVPLRGLAPGRPTHLSASITR